MIQGTLLAIPLLPPFFPELRKKHQKILKSR